MRPFILLSLLVAADASAQCSTATLSCSSTIANALTSSDCASFDGSVYDTYAFAGTAGDTISIEMHSTAFDTYLGLIDQAGRPVIDNDDLSTSSSDSKITWTLPAAGTWTIFANSLASAKTGDYTLTLSCASTSVPAGPKRRAVRRG
jgi:hypothetical protein